MYPQAFSLLSEDNPPQVFAVGLEIIDRNGEIDSTITYRPEPNGHYTVGTHTTAEAARTAYSRITPLTLERH